MAYETNWFEDQSVEKAHQRCFWRRIGFGIFFAIAAALLLFPMLTGCAAGKDDPKVCFIQLMGQSEEGYTVIAQQCMSPEQFTEMQKK